MKHSEESKRKMSDAAKKRSDKYRIKMSKSLKGRTHSKETKIKISESKIGKPLSLKSRQKISKSLKRSYFP